MWNESWTHPGITDWAAGGWHWLFGFHRLFSIVFIAIIVFAVVALIRDFRRRDYRPPAGNDRGPGRIGR